MNANAAISQQGSVCNGQDTIMASSGGQPANRADRNRDGDASEVAVSAPNPSGGYRVACDSCHQAKTRCTGGHPCQSCAESQICCTYSPRNRLGRPKGSKNKRPVQRTPAGSKAKQAKGPPAPTSRRSSPSNDPSNRNHGDSGHSAGNGASPSQSSQPQGHDPAPSSMGDWDLDHDFDGVFGTDLLADGSSSSFLNSWIDSESTAHAQRRPLDHGPLRVAGPVAAAETQVPAHPTMAFTAPFPPRLNTGYPPLMSDVPVGDAVLPSPQDPVHPCSGTARSPPLGPWARPPCLCLQQQVQLLYKLGDLQFSHAAAPTADGVLRGVDLAQKPWADVMRCSLCRTQGSQQEVLQLFAMSIRILLISVQKLVPKLQGAGVSCEREQASALHPAALSARILIGSHELTGDTKSEVINLVLRNAMDSISAALMHLWDRTGRPMSFQVAGMDMGRLGGNTATRTPASPPRSVLSGFGADTQSKHTHASDTSSVQVDEEDIGSLINTLQHTMQALKQNQRRAG
jgi:hypothetical protein